MAKGVKKIKWDGTGRVFNASRGSVANELLVVPPSQTTWFVVGEWYPGTSEEEKKRDLKWAIQNRRGVIDFQKTLGYTYKYGFTIPKKLCGPYTWYVEASWSGSFDGKAGLRIRGESPARVVNSRWTRQEGKEDVRKTYHFSYGEELWLRLFTEGLNGHTRVEVKVFRKLRGMLGLLPKDDEVTRKIYFCEVINGEINLRIPNTYSWGRSIPDRSSVEEFYVRVVHPTTGAYIQDDNGDTAHARFLRIKNVEVSQVVEPPQNRVPVTIYEPDRNAARFELCKFEKINVKEGSNAPVTVFDNGAGVRNQSRPKDRVNESVIFEFDSTKLSAESLRKLNNILQFILEHNGSSIQLDGFACVIGKQNYNKDLSEKRAETVKQFFRRGRVAENRIRTSGKGEVDPTDDRMGRDNVRYRNERTYQDNRRVDIAFDYYGHNAETIIYEAILGSRPTNILVEPVNFDTKACFENPAHTQKIRVSNINYKSEEDNKITIPAVSSMSPVNLVPLNYIWPKREGIVNSYLVHIHSCRYFSVRNNPTVNVRVYSDIKWTVEFKWSHTQPFAYSYGNHLYGYELDAAREKAIGAAFDSAWSRSHGEMAQKFNLSLVGEWTGSNGSKQKLELGKEWAERIAKTLRLFNKIKEVSDTIIQSPVARGKWSFEVLPPVVAVSAQWFLTKTNGKVGEIVVIGADTKPLVEANTFIDLFRLFVEFGGNAICPGAGTVINWVLEKLEKNVRITFKVNFGGAFNVNGQTRINVLFPRETTGEIKATGEIKVSVEFNALAKAGTANMGVEGIIKADAKSSITGGLQFGADKEGIYAAPIASFSGIKASFVAAVTVKFGIFKRTFQMNDEATLVKENAIEFQRNYI